MVVVVVAAAAAAAAAAVAVAVVVVVVVVVVLLLGLLQLIIIQYKKFMLGKTKPDYAPVVMHLKEFTQANHLHLQSKFSH